MRARKEGYRSGENLAAVEAHGSTPYIALAKGEDPAAPDDRACIGIGIDEKGDVTVSCPAGVEMSVKTKHADGSIGVRLPNRLEASVRWEMHVRCGA